MGNKSGTRLRYLPCEVRHALQGIGGTLSPQIFSGTKTIALPPGRNGFQPQLNLVYSTGNGNGSFGLWLDFECAHSSRQNTLAIISAQQRR